MSMLRVLGLAILLGAAAAGLTWFGWGIVANVQVALRRGRAPAGNASAPAGSGEANPAPR